MAFRPFAQANCWQAVGASLRPPAPQLSMRWTSTSMRWTSTSSSTSAIAYKALRRRHAPLPANDTPSSWSAQSAVSNILYETPTPSTTPPKRHTLNCLVQNEPGVLSRVSGILAARGFNIDSLVVCSTEVEDLSRMTIVLTGQDGVVEQARRQLEDLVPVWAVLDYTNAALVQRELLLAKINILGPEYFEELLAHHREMTTEGDVRQEANDTSLPNTDEDFHPSKIVASQALRHKHEHLKSITYFTHQFGGKVLDISTSSCIVEVSAKPMRIDSFLKLIAPFGILESTRTGLMALPRSPLYGPDEESQIKEADEVVDASQLPPG
ncbi:acetolactate synthase [Biscogniauxia marginata]|nr:acetolactate synthase [Biscogniauxia marginata]